MTKPGRNSINIEAKAAAVYGLFKNIQYTSWYALAEYVDNSVQSYIDHKEELSELGCNSVVVKIDIGSDALGSYISIDDNAGGIGDEKMDDAFRIIKATGRGDTLNEFGLGMKVASIWFGSSFSVETTALGENYRTKVIFDLDEIRKNDSEEISGKNLKISKAKIDDHFTRIKIRKINSNHLPKGGAIGRIRDHLGDIHSQFLKDHQLKLSIQSKDLDYKERKAFKKQYWKNRNGPLTEKKFIWKKKFRFDLSEPYEYAEGYIGLLPSFSKTKSGLMIFRRGRAVYGTGSESGEKYKPYKIFGPTNERLYRLVFGNIRIGEHAPVSSNKTLVMEGIESEFIEKLKEVFVGDPRNFEKNYESFDSEEINNILPLQRMGNSYRKTKDQKLSKTKKEKKAREATETTGEIVEKEFPGEAEEIIKNPEIRIDEKIDYSEPVLSEKNIEVMVSDTKWDVTFSVIENPEKKWFIYEKTKNKNEIHVRINLSHPFTENFLDKDGILLIAFLRIAAALSLAEIICERQNTKQASALRHTFNRIMDGSLSKRE